MSQALGWLAPRSTVAGSARVIPKLQGCSKLRLSLTGWPGSLVFVMKIVTTNWWSKEQRTTTYLNRLLVPRGEARSMGLLIVEYSSTTRGYFRHKHETMLVVQLNLSADEVQSIQRGASLRHLNCHQPLVGQDRSPY